MTSGALRVAVTVEQLWHRVPGGTATSILRTLEALRERTDVDVLGVSGRHREPPEPSFRTSVEVRQLPLPRVALYEAWQRFRRPAVQRATGPVDVVHATTMAVPPRTAPLVVTVHDLAFLRAPEHFSQRGNRFFRRGLELVRRDADLVLAPSEATLDDCERAGIDRDRLRLVPWGVRALDVTPEDVRRVLTSAGVERPYVLWVGTLEPRKNLRTVLAAYERMLRAGTELNLVLVGPHGWGDAGTSALRELPAGRVHAVGFVSDPDLHALYAGARAFCYPSLWEGFGMPVLEAMAHGVPVVTSTGTPMEGLVADGGRHTDPQDAEALASALLDVTGDRRETLAANASRRASLFTWERTAGATLTAYRAVSAR